MKKLKLLILVILSFATPSTVFGKISRIEIVRLTDGENKHPIAETLTSAGSNAYSPNTFNWNATHINTFIPIGPGHSYQIIFYGENINNYNRYELTNADGTGSPSGITITSINRHGAETSNAIGNPEILPYVVIRFRIATWASSTFMIRFRYAVETNGTSCFGSEAFCGDNVKFKKVQQPTITQIVISPAPQIENDAIVLKKDIIYTLTFTLDGGLGTLTRLVDNTLIKLKNPSNPEHFIENTDKTLAFIGNSFITQKSTNTFSMQIRCIINESNVQFTGTTYNVFNFLKKAFVTSDATDVFRLSNPTTLTVRDANHLVYPFASTLPNSTGALTLTNSGGTSTLITSGGTRRVNLLKVQAESKLPDIVPLTFEPKIAVSSITEPLVDGFPFFRPKEEIPSAITTGVNSNAYLPIDPRFLNLAQLQFRPREEFTDGNVTGFDWTIPLGSTNYGVKNIGQSTGGVSFNIRVMRFKSLSDVSTDDLGTLHNQSVFFSENFPVPNGGTRITSFTRPTVHIYEINGAPYLKRSNINVPGPDEEGAYVINVDYDCFIIDRTTNVRTPMNCITPYKMVREGNENNNRLVIHQ